jgi:hypothetical protein
MESLGQELIKMFIQCNLNTVVGITQLDQDVYSVQFVNIEMCK